MGAKIIKKSVFIIMAAAASLLLSSLSALAFDWNIKEGDERLSGAQVKQMVFGKTVIYSGFGKEHYNSDGSYKYVEENGKIHAAKSYSFYKDGSRCIFYEGDYRRCDLYVKHEGKLLVINSQGGRYKVKIK